MLTHGREDRRAPPDVNGSSIWEMSVYRNRTPRIHNRRFVQEIRSSANTLGHKGAILIPGISRRSQITQSAGGETIKTDIAFKSSGDEIVGHLYGPDDFSPSKQYPAIVVGGPLGTVNEQAAGVFAEALGENGFVALAFEYRRYGASEGEPRLYEDPGYENGTT